MTRLFIKIEQRPRGDAPEWVRDNWIGLDIPLVPGHGAYSHQCGTIGLTQPDPTQIEQWIGFYVLADEAIVALEESGRIEAAHWWRENTSCEPQTYWMFDAECCHLIPWNDNSPN